MGVKRERGDEMIRGRDNASGSSYSPLLTQWIEEPNYSSNPSQEMDRMAAEFEITIRNKLVSQRKDINVYHYATRSAHIISHNSSITLPFKTSGEMDFLSLSIPSVAGRLRKKCLIDLPEWSEVELSLEGKITIFQREGRILLKIPAGAPIWELKLTCSAEFISNLPLNGDSIIIGDEDKNNIEKSI